MTFRSTVEDVGRLHLPPFQGIRVMMLPLDFAEYWMFPASLIPWQRTIRALVKASGVKKGVGYLTIDEATVKAGETHRRPGLHVDGVDELGNAGTWSGGGWGRAGMITASDVVGCRAWDHDFAGAPGPNGDCEHLRHECQSDRMIDLQPFRMYAFSGLTVHEGLRMPITTRRTFVRLSYPSHAAWYEGYTENPYVKPTGPIRPRRVAEMGFRP